MTHRSEELLRAVLSPAENCSYLRTLHAARVQEDLPLDMAATIAIAALRYGPHGRLRAPRDLFALELQHARECHCDVCGSMPAEGEELEAIRFGAALVGIELCYDCGATLVHVVGPNVRAQLCPDCDAGSSCFDDYGDTP